MDGELLSLKWNNHKSTFLQVIKSLRNERESPFADATIACDGSFYPVHRLVLSSCSDYFSSIFDATTCRNPVIVLKDIDSRNFEYLLDYMYVGEVNVRQTELRDLVGAAESLKIKGLAVPDDEILKPTNEVRNSVAKNKLPSQYAVSDVECKKRKLSKSFPTFENNNNNNEKLDTLASNDTSIKTEPVDDDSNSLSGDGKFFGQGSPFHFNNDETEAINAEHVKAKNEPFDVEDKPSNMDDPLGYKDEDNEGEFQSSILGFMTDVDSSKESLQQEDESQIVLHSEDKSWSQTGSDSKFIFCENKGQWLEIIEPGLVYESHHGSVAKMGIPTVNKNSNKDAAKYFCQFCNHSTMYKGNLARHIRIHTDENCLKIVSPSLADNKNNRHWRPKVCKLTQFTKDNSIKCFANNRPEERNVSIAFLGDSHQKRLTTSFLQKIETKNMIKSSKTLLNKQTLKAEFYEPDHSILFNFRYFPFFNNSFMNIFRKWEKNKNYPDLLVIGCNLHPILDFNSSNKILHEFRQNLTRHLPILNRIAKKGNVLWYVQPPLKRSRKVLTNEQVSIYNSMVTEVLKGSRVHLWTAPRLIGFSDLKMYDDEVHLTYSSVHKLILLLLNFHCNSRVFPNESFCCSDKRREINNYFNQYSCLSVLSALTLCIFLVVQIPSSEMSLKRSYFPLTSGEKKTTDQLYHEWKIKISILGSFLIKFIVYFGFIYICDRTPLFEKEEKTSNFPIFPFFMTIFFLFIKFQNFSEEETKKSKYFVAEGQGLSILVLIFLNLVEDSRAAIVAKFLKSSLLILTGIRLFQEYWHYEYSVLYYFLKKFVQLNSLFILMVFILNQSYQFYGLSLVLTTSFTLCSIVLAIPVGREKSATFYTFATFLCKFFAILLILYYSSGTKGLKIFSHTFLRLLFETKDFTFDFELWEREKYSLLLGLIMGCLCEFFPYLSEIFKSNFGSGKFSKYLQIFLGCVVVASVVYYTINFLQGFYLDSEHESSHLWFCILLIFVFMVSRWLLLKFKSIYFPRLEVIGDSWIEIYILHFHVFLAHNGTAILQFISFSAILNELILFILLIILSLEFQSMITFISKIFSIKL